MSAEVVKFDDASRCSLSNYPMPSGGAPEAIRSLAEHAGMDPIAELYNEALSFATDRQLRGALERLHMLLAMVPNDAEALFLLARVYVAQQRWHDALQTLDIAEQAGLSVPHELRTAVQEHQSAEGAAEEEERLARKAREDGESRTLRTEARRLHSENAQLAGRLLLQEAQIKKWALTTAGVCILTIGFLIVNLMSGLFSTNEIAPVNTAVEQRDEIVSEAIVKPDAPPVNTNTAEKIAQRAAKALATAKTLDNTSLEVEILAGSAKLLGLVPTYSQRKEAERILLGVEGIAAVDTSEVEILARTLGTTHVVRPGDVLSTIASRYYGKSSASDAILKANQSLLKGKTTLNIGQTLIIPKIE